MYCLFKEKIAKKQLMNLELKWIIHDWKQLIQVNNFE